MIPNAGTYPGRTNGQLVVYESERTGSLCLAVPCRLHDSVPPWSGRFTAALILGDGTASTRTIDNLKRIFGWDGIDPFWFMDQDFSEVEFDIVGEHEAYTPEGGETRMTFKIKYLNPPGESGGAKMPEAGDRKALLAKYGSKFRALSSTAKPAAAATKKAAPAAVAAATQEAELPPQTPAKKSAPPAQPPAKKKPATTAGGQPPTATMEEAWEAFCAANDGKSESDLGGIWYSAIEEAFPGKNNSDLTIQQWGHLKSILVG